MAPVGRCCEGCLWIYVLVVCARVVAGTAVCSWEDPQGTVYDFSALGKLSPVVYTGGPYAYYVNVCNGTIPNCGTPSQITPTCQEWTFPAVQSVSLGELSTQNITSHPSGAGVRMEYTMGSSCGTTGGRSMTIDLLCNYDVKDLKVLDIYEGVACQYSVTVESMHGCPVDCPEGFRGPNCTQCLPYHYGAECDSCDCKYGRCFDGIENNGTCECESGWTGKSCDECDSSFCTYYTPDGKYVYDLSAMAQDDFDYTYTQDQYTMYYVNILARTNRACGSEPTAACQYWSDPWSHQSDQYSLGRPSTAIVQQLSQENSGGGVKIAYSEGTPCGSAEKNRSSVVELVCAPGSSTQIQRITEVSTCVYEIVVLSSLSCPNCTEGKFGPSCLSCTCVNGECSQGIEGNGQCECFGSWSGQHCDECVNGWGHLCNPCACQGGTCNSTTGACSCHSGFQGTNCSECRPDFFGASCQPCSCGPHGVCNDTITGDGLCQCREGFAGSSCDACSAGYYGESCTACECNRETSICLDGITEDGACVCLAGFSGSGCTKEAWSAGYFAAIGGVGMAAGFFIGAAVSALICMCWLGRRLKYQAIE